MIVKSTRGNFFYAVAILIGMIIGAGIFGIPYVVAQAGFAVGLFYLVLLGGAVMLLHLFYGEIVLRTKQEHRLIGYAAKYLGKEAKKIATLTVLFEYYGSLLAYIIIGGNFLMIILGRFFGGNEVFWAAVFFVVGATLIFCGLKTVVKNELFLTGLLLASLAAVLFSGLPQINFDNLKTVNFNKFFLPYGVILFSLAGSAVIPEVRKIMTGQEKRIKKVIIFGTLIPAIFYLFFALVVVGITGSGTTEEAINGLIPYLGNWIISVGAIFGILAVFTSFLVLGLGLEEIFHDDYRIKKRVAFCLALFVPFLAYLFGLKSFIFIIGLVGALAAGIDGILTVLIYFKAKKAGDRQPEYQIKTGIFWGWLLILMFSLGFIYQFVYLSTG